MLELVTQVEAENVCRPPLADEHVSKSGRHSSTARRFASMVCSADARVVL